MLGSSKLKEEGAKSWKAGRLEGRAKGIESEVTFKERKLRVTRDCLLPSCFGNR